MTLDYSKAHQVLPCAPAFNRQAFSISRD